MLEAILAGDADLGERAVTAAREVVKTLGYPVRRSQVKGLLALASSQADKLAEFASHQQDRAQKRFKETGEKNQKFQEEALFWERVANLCKGTRPKHDWSLNQARDAALPAELIVPPQPPGARLSKEEQERRKRQQEAEKLWKQTWFAEHAAVFFRRFCAEYLMNMPSEKSERDE